MLASVSRTELGICRSAEFFDPTGFFREDACHNGSAVVYRGPFAGNEPFPDSWRFSGFGCRRLVCCRRRGLGCSLGRWRAVRLRCADVVKNNGDKCGRGRCKIYRNAAGNTDEPKHKPCDHSADRYTDQEVGNSEEHDQAYEKNDGSCVSKRSGCVQLPAAVRTRLRLFGDLLGAVRALDEVSRCWRGRGSGGFFGIVIAALQWGHSDCMPAAVSSTWQGVLQAGQLNSILGMGPLPRSCGAPVFVD